MVHSKNAEKRCAKGAENYKDKSPQDREKNARKDVKAQSLEKYFQSLNNSITY
jgi:hypothetical protein